MARSGIAGFEIVPAALRHLRAFWPLVREQWRTLKLSAGPSFFGPLGRRRWALDEPSPFEAVRVMDPAPDARLLRDVMEGARRVYPALAEARPVEAWAGMIDVTPDELPVIDHAAPGLVVATGLSGPRLRARPRGGAPGRAARHRRAPRGGPRALRPRPLPRPAAEGRVRAQADGGALG